MRSTSNMIHDVADFHDLILQDAPAEAPSLISLEYCVERARFLAEELDEFMVGVGESDMVKIADALADIVYVALGTAHKMGLPFEEIWAAVQIANMQKQRGITKRGNAVDAVKPAGWVGPEAAIARAIARKLA